MALSKELVSQFVKTVNNRPRTSTETTVYGTAVIQDNTVYVRLDGSNIDDLPTPVVTTSDVKDGDRVTVMIKDRAAVVTGNLSARSATKNNVNQVEQDLTALFNNVIAGTVTADQLNAVKADINDLKAKDVTIEGSLKTNTAAINDLTANKLDSNSALIKDLEAGIANIDTLIFGTASGDVIQTSFANAVIAQLGNAQIKSAMIDNVSADKITAGDVITNNVRVMSEDGKLLISDETIQISDATRVRVQIGKDASGDYSISIWDADGNLMFSEGGITDNAIKNAIIRDDMVSDTANISARKIDINSLFEEINNSSKTIKSTKIYLDDKNQTLDVAFTSLTSDVEDIDGRVTSQGTQISAIQGQITSKVWQQDIDESVDGLDNKLSTKYSELEQTVDGISLEVSNVQVGGRNLLRYSQRRALNSNNSALYPVTYSKVTENGREFNRYIRTETDLAPTTMSLYSSIPVTEITEVLTGQEITFSFLIRCSHSTVTNTMNTMVINGTNNPFGTTETHTIDSKWKRISLTATITSEYEVVGTNLLRFNPMMITIPAGAIDTFYVDVCEWKIEKGNKATDWTPAPEDVYEKFDDYSTTAEMTAAIDLKADGIFSTVKSTYTAKEEFNNLNVGGRNLVRDGSLNAKTDRWVFSTDNEYSFEHGYCEVYRNTASGSRTFNSQSTNNNALLKPDNLSGGTFTLSAEIKLLDGYTIANGSTLFYRCNTTELSSGFQEITVQLGGATTEWTKVSGTYTFGEYNFDGSCQVCIALANVAGIGVCIRNVKLERGNKATDWTPAPEDVDSSINSAQSTADRASEVATSANERVTSAETLIQQLSNCISMLVTDENGETLMTQTEDGWTFSMKETSEAVSTLMADLEALQRETGDTQSAVEVLQQAVSDHGRALEYVNVTTYEDEPCIELGESDSDFKLLITNTRIMFMNGSNVPTYINTNGLVTQNIDVKGEIVQGGYVMLNTADGGWGLLWKGVSS